MVSAMGAGEGQAGGPKFCSNCGAAHEPGEKFCPSCGHAFGGDAASGAPAAVEPEAVTTVAPAPASAPVPPPPAPVPPPAAPVPPASAPQGAPVPPPAGGWPAPPPVPGPEHEDEHTINIYQYAGGVAPPGAPVAGAPVPAAGGHLRRLGESRQGPHVTLRGRKIHALPVVAGVALIVSSFLDWFVVKGRPGADSFDFPFKFLFDPNNAGNGFKLGVVVVLLGAAAIALAVFSLLAPVRRLVGLAAIAVALAYAGQLYHQLNDAGRSFGDLFSYLGPGPYVALIAGIFVTQK
jgi:hypothetical protein